MAYVELNDFSRVISKRDLNDLIEEASEDYKAKSSDEVRQDAEKMAESKIRLYLGLRFDLDTEFAKDPSSTDRDETILECYLHLSVYMLHFAINSRDIPEDRQNQFDMCIKLLEQLRDGELYSTLDPITETAGSILTEANRKFISKPFDDAGVLDNETT